MKNTKRAFVSGRLAVLFCAALMTGVATASDITVRPGFEGPYVSSATVLTDSPVVQIVLHHCNGERTSVGPEEAPSGDAVPVSAGGVLLAGVTVVADGGVEAVAFPCPVGDDPAAVSAARPRPEAETIEGALF